RRQGRVEPAPVLVRPLQIQIRRPSEPLVLHQHGGMAAARIQPYIHGVRFLAEGIMTAFRTADARRKQLLHILGIPGGGAFLLENGRDPVDRLLRDQRVIALLAVEDRQGNAPHPLAGNRSEEHTSELQSRENLVCRLLLEKKNERVWKAEGCSEGTMCS